jgi:hypothetical protein
VLEGGAGEIIDANMTNGGFSASSRSANVPGYDGIMSHGMQLEREESLVP